MTTLGVLLAALGFIVALSCGVFLWRSISSMRLLGMTEVWHSTVGLLGYMGYFLLVALGVAIVGYFVGLIAKRRR